MNPKRKQRISAPAAVNWPKDVEQRLKITPWVRWHWEKSGKLPTRDINIGGKTGWLAKTIDALLEPPK